MVGGCRWWKGVAGGGAVCRWRRCEATDVGGKWRSKGSQSRSATQESVDLRQNTLGVGRSVSKLPTLMFAHPYPPRWWPSPGPSHESPGMRPFETIPPSTGVLSGHDLRESVTQEMEGRRRGSWSW